jgi:DNA-binding response OmpR family regulator
MILLVEDDGEFRRLISLSLRLAGFETREARDGLEALAILECERIDAVVLDVNLPRVDGISVRHEIASQARTSALPVIFITASDVPLHQENPACVLRKPFTTSELIAAVEKCVKETQLGAGLGD